MIEVPFHQDSQVVRGFIRFSRTIAVLMIAVASIVLVAWWWDARLPTAVVPGQRSMKVNAAIGFALSGSALLLSQGSGRVRSRLGPWLSLAVMGIGLATLAEYVWSLDIGIDRLLDDSFARQPDPLSGRMAELVATAFVLLGGLGVMVSTRRWLYLREGLAVVLLAIAMTGLASYGFALAGRDSGPFNRVPIYTTLLLLLATLGWIASTPTIGLTRVTTADTLGGAFARRLLLPALLMPVIVAFVFEMLQSRLGLSEALAFSFVALFSGGAVAWLVWWVATLLDKLERQRRKSLLLRNDADTDTLTGLANRRAFDDALANLLRGQREHDMRFSLLMLDLDRFKSYNDDFGHLAGDEVLRITGHLLGAALRPSDLAARYGGEEFALLLPDTDVTRAGEVAARILDAFRGFAWPQRAVTISIGVAQSAPSDGSTDLIQRADAMLYDAKHAGRDRVMVATAVVSPGAVRSGT
ncbi:GGDEF domain-containing protein [Rhodanobacter glycinis]|uniref:diguanylate cyclase n=1 Tax=Rhodanobacter glycinis TaxID=582702 RepID=A0A502FGY0_9GAMM|nr:GGDEF domain-containing protein [Rhodanobacter glycinis]TPG11121.1 GGDEF domain-containing protein [Rhodanobacter glycinis]TPG48609.1 GGDEF domain-containing protein [Rhodanobacter glycinis]